MQSTNVRPHYDYDVYFITNNKSYDKITISLVLIYRNMNKSQQNGKPVTRIWWNDL